MKVPSVDMSGDFTEFRMRRVSIVKLKRGKVWGMDRKPRYQCWRTSMQADRLKFKGSGDRMVYMAEKSADLTETFVGRARNLLD